MVDSKSLSIISILSVMVADQLEVLGEDIESEFVLLFGSIGFTVLGNIVVELVLGFSINLE